MAESTWSYVCSQSQYLYTLIITLFIVLFLALFAIFFGEPGTISHTLAIVDVGLTLVAFAITSYVYRKCQQRMEGNV